MRKILSILSVSVFILTISGCGSTRVIFFDRIYKTTMTIDDAIKEKEQLDQVDNPARKDQIEKSLAERLIKVDNLKVRDVVVSTDIDYGFCVIAEYPTPKGLIDFYIYSKDNQKLAKLEKGKSKINVHGYFRRFFKLIDNTWFKIDIGDTKITIVE
jgi:hypothetical protein